ncbi:sterile alpha and TIR motif-containing protein 1-like isoform X2 [Melanaphis sacchari]|uniref:sterile alpha and TIR motif-containing protein 1-like isoform X2 n=1 Tax=Melanaphis sacchari TaxID=742174 RepID=UPI000DC13F2E|nr:sterile alpha and TIR motif-containing protein 1-like isoform X2 [Melanaphis sacchari]
MSYCNGFCRNLLPNKIIINLMAPGALQQNPMISSMNKSQLSSVFNKNDVRASLTSDDAVITHQIDFSPDNGESSPHIIINHPETRSGNSKKKVNDLDMMQENAAKSLFIGKYTNVQESTVLTQLFYLIRNSWTLPTHEVGYALCNRFRDCGGTDFLLKNCVSEDPILQFFSTRLLVECLNSENRDYMIKNGLIQIKYVILKFKCQEKKTADQSKVITGLLAKLFEHSEEMCMVIIEWGGLEILLKECQSQDTTTLQNCACALANLSLYGDSMIHKLMIHHHAHTWLFTLAFNADDSVKYYALLAAAVLITDKDIKTAMNNCDTLDLIDPFIATHFPTDFVRIDMMLGQFQDQGQDWLQRLVPVLSCDRREACTLAAFHFCAIAYLQSQCPYSKVAETFRMIGAVAPLKKLVVSLNNVTSALAAQALQWIGEQVPRSLSQEVPQWTVTDVLQWIKSVGFGECAEILPDNQMNGDWLLKLTEECLKKRFKMQNGITRKRFMRELHKLKQLADYSCKDPTNLNSFLQSIKPEFSVYTYSMLNAGVDKYSIRSLTDDQLACECRISNSFHRSIILNFIKGKR